MDEKPTFASVTTVPCTCGYLERSADEPLNPIVFDVHTNEFHFKNFDRQRNIQSTFVIFHCPSCGGVAPKSKRELLFALIPADEAFRLSKILSPIKTIDDAIKSFGTPDFDDYSFAVSREQENTPSSVEPRREIRFYGLSDTADVLITEQPDGAVCWKLDGKHLDVPRTEK